MADKFLSGGIIANSTSVSIPVTFRKNADNTGETGKVAADMTASYWRQGGSRVAIVLSDLAAVTSAYSSGGVKEIDATNMPGEYRLDLPNAAIASGVDWVDVVIYTAASMYSERIDLMTLIPFGDCYRNTVMELQGSYTAQQIFSIGLSILAGVTSNSGTTFKTPDGNCTRVAATLSGCNRTAMTLTPSA